VERGRRAGLESNGRRQSGYFLRRNCIVDVFGLKVFLSAQDMNREVVKTDSATTRIPELDFEIPAFSQKGGKLRPEYLGLYR
jgi:hypothetical protein